MKIFRIKSTSPYTTLSLEELITSDPEMTGDIFLIYQHDNAVIIGRNQNAYEEIKRDYIEENKIELARRISGGGAVYHDLGNINFSFITDYNKQAGYEKFLQPIISFLNSLGLNAEFQGRNDILCNGAKISGNAQFIKGNRIVSHGTLLFDVDLTKLSNALNPSKLKLESKGVQSIRQRVTNIAKELNYSMSVEEFIEKLIEHFVKNGDGEIIEIPYKKYEDKLNQMIEYKKSNEWLYNKNADFQASNAKKFPGGILKIKYNVENNKFKEIVFEGDFLSKLDVNEMIGKFDNLEYSKQAVIDVLNSIRFEEYFGTIQIDEILELIFG
ncbi:lipoyltransferase [Mycoplasmopsis anatis]|uniref:lipoate--protein ligase n=1 Tax=Mycoplasmopsis anatis TaxID=171279 RepID=A0A9Q3L9D4_9BACT|nr:lipoate--protein ligase [Mycoplasmopsis anatis]MBW0594313.1 lipoyltransferase [Mycoplasmopsis anatis]MBW0595136.1 lipoyltransferase [Mycoplasmopsis anatis]MBW0596546.1 lipoyltransferase [Mycoplasmopsis anatis]MBW0597929.1 lipoyltransferase [Mycoplasmopsis anatis]MBW0598692.1 lipoyltransferase [Mycoplasmopsis anatis]